MNLNDLSLTHLITLGTIYVGSLWGLVKIIAMQQEKQLVEKFAALSNAIGEMGKDLRREADATRALERSFMQSQTELARDYVRRDDFVRAFGIIEARIDNFAFRMERALSGTAGEGRPS